MNHNSLDLIVQKSLACLSYMMLTSQYSGFIIGTSDHNSFLFISSAIDLFDFHRKKQRYFHLTILLNHNSLDLIVQKL